MLVGIDAKMRWRWARAQPAIALQLESEHAVEVIASPGFFIVH